MNVAPYSFDPSADGLGGRATSGMVQTGLAQGIRLAVQFGSVIVLSRLLPPSEFGLLAMAGPLVGFAALFQDLGLTQAVVQKARLTQAEVSALFAISLGVSAALALLVAAASPLASWFYGEPRVGALMAAMGLNIVLGGAGSLHYALLNRRMQFGALAFIDAAAAVGGLAASAAFALVYPNAWALYAGAVAGSLIPAAGYWIASGWRPSLPRRGAGVGAALRFGANVTGFNLANFLARNLDNVLIGRAWGGEALGLYDRAYKLLLAPLQQINNPVSKVMLPVLSHLLDDPARYRSAFLRTLSQVLLLSLPGVAFMAATSDLLVPVLLGQQWAGAAPIFTALGAAAFLQVLNNPTGWLFISQGRTREYFHWGLFGSATSIISFVVGLPYGPLGVAVAYAAGEYVRTPILWWYVARRGPVRVRDIVRLALPHFTGVAASLAAIAGVRLLFSAPWATLGLSLAASFAAALAALALFSQGRDTLGETLRLAWRAWTRLVPRRSREP